MKLLEGVRVLDLTNVLAGPFCCYQLAQLGADVIKVEVPRSGDLARQLGADPELNKRLMGASFLAQNAGKRSVTINLKSPAGKEVFHRLAATADVVVENFRPGVMDRLGLGYDALRKVKANLIYCAISGFGKDGPLKDNPAYDQIVQGISGVMSVTGDKAVGAAACRLPRGRYHRRHYRGIGDCSGALSTRSEQPRRIHRRLDARGDLGDHGMGRIKLADRRCETTAYG